MITGGSWPLLRRSQLLHPSMEPGQLQVFRWAPQSHPSPRNPPKLHFNPRSRLLGSLGPPASATASPIPGIVGSCPFLSPWMGVGASKTRAKQIAGFNSWKFIHLLCLIVAGCITCWCPCITFGQIAEIVDKGSSGKCSEYLRRN